MATPQPSLRMAVGDLLARRSAALAVPCPFDTPFTSPAALYGFEHAICKSGGREIFDELRLHKSLPPGAAVASGAGRLAARWVLHVAALGPGRQASPQALFTGLGIALRLAVMLGADEVAVPLIGAGAGGLGDEGSLGLIVSAWLTAPRKPAQTTVVVLTRALAAKLGPSWGLGAEGEGASPRGDGA